jgi:hypothetical protein
VEQLEVVLSLNPGNQQVESLLNDIRSGRQFESASTASTSEQVVETDSPVDSADGTVTTTEAPDTSLISPVNPVEEGEAAPVE